MSKLKKIIFSVILLLILTGCVSTTTPLYISNGEKVTVEVGEVIDLDYVASADLVGDAVWTTSNTSAIVDSEGIVTGRVAGECVVTITIGTYSDTIVIEVVSTSKVEIKVKLSVTDEALYVGDTTTLVPSVTPSEYLDNLEYVITTGEEHIEIEGNTVTALSAGIVMLHAKVDGFVSSSIVIEIEEDEYFDDPYENVDKEEFYDNYIPATSYLDAQYRTEHGLMSGSIADQDQEPTIASNRPMENGLYVRNSSALYSKDGNTYYIVDANGEIVNEVYKGGAYVTLEEVAAYVFAFGDIPANYSSKKSTKPSSSIWGEYLRVNHTVFSGNTSRYPYEPELPNISGCGGDLTYYEMDLGTTGTDCDPSYPVIEYNDGKSIERGAARIVYSRFDKNGDQIIDVNEKYLFYTYNHYNDFQEYLNYEGGWGEMFGNITGGGTLSSKYDYNPTPYVPVVFKDLTEDQLSLNFNQFGLNGIYAFLVTENKKYYQTF